MKTPDGIALVRKLVSCDIVIEFRPGVLDRLGISAAAMRKEVGTDLGFDQWLRQNGPYRDKPAYDMIVQALHRGHEPAGETGGPPVRAGIPIGISRRGCMRRRDARSAAPKKPGAANISTSPCSVVRPPCCVIRFIICTWRPGRQGRGHDSISTYRGFTAKDGVDVVVTNTERMWSACAVRWVVRPRPRSRLVTGTRYDNRSALWPILERRFSSAPPTRVPLLEQEFQSVWSTP